MSEKMATASVRILTNESGVNFISQALGFTPTRQNLKGQLRSKQNPRGSVFDQSMWIYASPLADSSELHEHIEYLVKLLKGRAGEIRSIRQRITCFDVHCMFSSTNGQGSAELSSSLLKELGDLGVDLVIDLYPPN